MNQLLMSFKTSFSVVLLLISMFLIIPSVQAQQDSQYTQYMYDTHSINPAYAGSRGSLSIMGVYRNQWVGLEGAPKTLNFSAHSPIGVQGVGLGIGFTSDQIGPSLESLVTADFSYTIPLENNVKLAFGMKGGVSILDLDPNKLNIYNVNDYSLKHENALSPVIGVGLYLYTPEWYVGLSSPNILTTQHYDEFKVSTISEKTHAYLIGGYVFMVSANLKLKPTILAKAVVGAPLSLDFSANALLNETVTFGLAYRLNAAISALAGFQLSEQIMIGYAYDYDTTPLRNYTSGSHEMVLRFELGTVLNPKVNPRFF